MDPDAAARLWVVAVGRDLESRLGSGELVRLLREAAEARTLRGDGVLPRLCRAEWALGAARRAVSCGPRRPLARCRVRRTRVWRSLAGGGCVRRTAPRRP